MVRVHDVRAAVRGAARELLVDDATRSTTEAGGVKGTLGAGPRAPRVLLGHQGPARGSERPGGFARNHRKVRRQEELIWLIGHGFTHMLSMLDSPHNLHAYDEAGIPYAHVPLGRHDEWPDALAACSTARSARWLDDPDERVLIHHEEFGDRLLGVLAGYLLYAGLVTEGPHAIVVIEKITGRQLGSVGARDRRRHRRRAHRGDSADESRGAERRWAPSSIAGLRELGVHGVLPEEQTRPQPFEVDVELTVDLDSRGRRATRSTTPSTTRRSRKR